MSGRSSFIVELVQQEPSLFSEGIAGTNLMIFVLVIFFDETAQEGTGTHKMIKMTINKDRQAFHNFKYNVVLLV